MARQTIVRLQSDLDGSPADETVSFQLDSTAYEVDLTAEQAAELRGILAPYVACARGVRSAQRRKERTTQADDSTAVRSWARAHGYEISERGRIPAEIRAAYRNR